MPTMKRELLVKYEQWKDRPIQLMPTTTVTNTNIPEEEATMSDDEDMESVESDVVAALLQLQQVYQV